MLNTFAFLDDFCLQQRPQMKRRFFPMKEILGSGYNDSLLHTSYSTIQYVPKMTAIICGSISTQPSPI